MLRDRFGTVKISLGDIFRREIAEGTDLGKKVECYVKKGELVPDEIVNEVLLENVKGLESFVIDGYPRTMGQAEFLLENVKIDAMIVIKVHDEVLIEKIAGRRICSNPNCDGNYNISRVEKVVEGVKYFLPEMLPKFDMRCDKCGSPLIQRKDDKPEKVRIRLNVYKERTEPVMKYLMERLKTVEVWMNRPAEEVFEEIVEKLKILGLLE